LPQWIDFLDESEPIPVFALKLLASITDRSPIYSEYAEKLGIYP